MLKNKIFIISGPSGVGKNTIADMVLESTDNLEETVSMTSRKPIREGEIEGETYYFVTREEFMEAVENGEMLEWTEFSSNLYGTPNKSVFPKLEKGINILMVIDVKGAAALEEKMPEVISIFLMPPSVEELERRLRSRATDAEEYILKRLNEATMEMQLADKYDYTVVNDTLEQAVKDVKEIIQKEINK